MKKNKINNCKVSKKFSAKGYFYYLLEDSNDPNEPSLTNTIHESIDYLSKTYFHDIFSFPIVALGTDGIYCLICLHKVYPFICLSGQKSFAEELDEAIFSEVLQEFKNYLNSEKNNFLYSFLLSKKDQKGFVEQVLKDDLFFDNLKIPVDLEATGIADDIFNSLKSGLSTSK